jgi:hypothetical protein
MLAASKRIVAARKTGYGVALALGKKFDSLDLQVSERQLAKLTLLV